MTIAIRVTVETDIDSIAKVLMLADLPDKPRLSNVRAAAGDVLARHGLYGALRRYQAQLRDLSNDDELRDHENGLAWRRTLARQSFAPPKPRRRIPRPAPVGRPLIEALADD